MNGRKLPDTSREMMGYLAYLKFIGEPEAMNIEPAPAAPLPGDATRGAEVFGRICAACHQPDGLGKRWGALADGRTASTMAPAWIIGSARSASSTATCRAAPSLRSHSSPCRRPGMRRRCYSPSRGRITTRGARSDRHRPCPHVLETSENGFARFPRTFAHSPRAGKARSRQGRRVPWPRRST